MVGGVLAQSGAWDDNGVLIYTTLNHIKYCLPNGDSGIIRTLDVPVYITQVVGDVIFCLDRDGRNRQIQVHLHLARDSRALTDASACLSWVCAVSTSSISQSR